jgi:CheY-like chemotaxis protein
MHGGTVEAASDGVGEGAEFVVRLPVLEETTMEREHPTPVSQGERRLRLLVVDDNADLVDMLAAVLESAGHEVRTALDGASAVSAALSYRPDVVLLDVGLPGMSGLEVARELRRHPETSDMRLVALTGWGQAEDRRQTRDAGFDYHLTKPTQPEALHRLLEGLAATPRPER